METFITKIYVKELRGGVRDLEIPLSETNRQHLIITGKNGSGKTSLLEEIKKFLSQIETGMLQYYSLKRQKQLLLATNDTSRKLEVEQGIKNKVKCAERN